MNFKAIVDQIDGAMVDGGTKGLLPKQQEVLEGRLKELIAEQKEKHALAAENEPEPEGPMPKHILEVNATLEEYVRAGIRAAKRCIAARIRSL